MNLKLKNKEKDSLLADSSNEMQKDNKKKEPTNSI